MTALVTKELLHGSGSFCNRNVSEWPVHDEAVRRTIATKARRHEESKGFVTSRLRGNPQAGTDSAWTGRQGLVVLAVFARGASELPPEFPRKVALIREAAFQGDLGQRLIRVHQSAACKAQPDLSQESLRGEMEGGMELSFERAERHVRNGRELPIGDLVMEMGAHVSQRRPEAGAGVFEAARGSGGPSNPGRANDCAFRIDDGNLVGNVPDRRTLRLSDSFEPIDNAVAGQNLFIIVPELIGQERRGEIIVSPALNILESGKLLSARVIERVLNEKGSIDPQITPLPILHPRQDVGKKIQELGEMR